LAESKALTDLIKNDFVRIVPSLDYVAKAWLVTVHQIRVTCPPKGVGEPVPEGIHRDGHAYLAIHVVSRHNISSDPNKAGRSHVYTRRQDGSGAMELDKVIEEGEALFLNDSTVLHCVSGFVPENQEESAHRDVIIIDFDVVDHHAACS